MSQSIDISIAARPIRPHPTRTTDKAHLKTSTLSDNSVSSKAPAPAISFGHPNFSSPPGTRAPATHGPKRKLICEVVLFKRPTPKNNIVNPLPKRRTSVRLASQESAQVTTAPRSSCARIATPGPTRAPAPLAATVPLLEPRPALEASQKSTQVLTSSLEIYPQTRVCYMCSIDPHPDGCSTNGSRSCVACKVRGLPCTFYMSIADCHRLKSRLDAYVHEGPPGTSFFPSSFLSSHHGLYYVAYRY